MSKDEKKELERIKSGRFSRAFSLARMSVGAGARLAAHSAKKAFLDTEKGRELTDKFLQLQMKIVSQELGMLKGSLMKVGQVVSMVGEQVLPPEANAFLKTLQYNTPPVAWPEMEKVLLRELGPEKIAKLEIERKAHASASLGQVHIAIEKATGRKLALKIQYPGVDKAIETDISGLKRLLSMSRLIPADIRLGPIFDEVRELLQQEVDYKKESEWTKLFRERLKGDPRYAVPEVFEEFTTARVIATSFEEGIPIDSPEVLRASQKERDAIGYGLADLYIRELFVWGDVQTDSHFGNYKVRLRPGQDPQVVLLDFGAVRRFDEDFLKRYHRMIRSAYHRDRQGTWDAIAELGYARKGDDEKVVDAFYEICELFLTPAREENYRNGGYDWGTSDLIDRGRAMVIDLIKVLGLRPPPREFIFLDRKMLGLFVILSKLRCSFGTKAINEPYFNTFEIKLQRETPAPT